MLIVSLVDSLLSERVSNASSVRLMEHAATLDLEDFEDAGFQDQLERARRQTSGRMALIGQLFSQAQDIVTVGLSVPLRFAISARSTSGSSGITPQQRQPEAGG